MLLCFYSIVYIAAYGLSYVEETVGENRKVFGQVTGIIGLTLVTWIALRSFGNYISIYFTFLTFHFRS